MKYVYCEGKYYPIIDESATHWICPPANCKEGYQFFTKENFPAVDIETEKNV